MRARSFKPRKVNVVTLGCAKNIFDSEVMMAQLRANDYEVEHESKKDDAGIVVVKASPAYSTPKDAKNWLSALGIAGISLT